MMMIMMKMIIIIIMFCSFPIPRISLPKTSVLSRCSNAVLHWLLKKVSKLAITSFFKTTTKEYIAEF